MPASLPDAALAWPSAQLKLWCPPACRQLPTPNALHQNTGKSRIPATKDLAESLVALRRKSMVYQPTTTTFRMRRAQQLSWLRRQSLASSRCAWSPWP
ncbi:hypothetical protein MAPG_07626 [Magnaporthiopsis poae ATCC 64411]|uniref:Uncharacterized protein n=1 Tax=Magnaporthiopsis poae (strain ATCC 64411 / 73-15) TaxID=644358 RepID=A0A0C4E562_MAGP6|nr:hypothetical protein MAPG_07626 [Magnaporthiopsis poae ATCC 64411]